MSPESNGDARPMFTANKKCCLRTRIQSLETVRRVESTAGHRIEADVVIGFLLAAGTNVHAGRPRLGSTKPLRIGSSHRFEISRPFRCLVCWYLGLLSMSPEIDRLLRERQTTALRDRRAADRQPFVRPVQLELPRHEKFLQGFSRDVSLRGMSLITAHPIGIGVVGVLHIHSVLGACVSLRAEARWCEDFGRDWFVSGWGFLNVDA